MDRGRDRRHDDRTGSYESYRPSERQGRSPTRGDNYRAQRSPPRSPPRRARSPPPNNSYGSRGGRDNTRQRSPSPRRRSRSPAFQGRGDGGFRGRARTPPRGSGRPRSPPRGVDRPRSPPARRSSRSPDRGPGRARSPMSLKRSREPTPPGGPRQRSPPTKQGRFEQGRDDFDRRGYVSPKESHSRFPRENNYRPRPRSRTPPRQSAHASRGVSPNSSRRSSPPVHPDRLSAITRSPQSSSIVQQSLPETRVALGRSREQSPPPRSPSREASNWRDRTPPQHAKDFPPRHGATSNTWTNPQMVTPAPRNGDSRTPANGNSRYDEYARESARESAREPAREPARASPGPPSAPVSMSAHNRSVTASILTAPTRPRGGPSFGKDSPRDAPYGGPPGHRAAHQFSGPPPNRQASYDSSNVPTGPRSSYHDSGPRYDSHRVPFRSNNSTSATYPRTQRFSNHLSSAPSVIPGGKKLPSVLDPAKEKRLQQIEADKKKLLETIEEMERIKRQGLRDWEKAERESARDGLKSELAEGHLVRLSGEGGGSGAAAY